MNLRLAWGSRVETAVLALAALVLLVDVVGSLVEFQAVSYAWDWLFLTGLGLFLVAALCARDLPGRIEVVFTRLLDRRLLLARPDQMAALRATLARRDQTWANLAGLIVAGLLALATVFAFGVAEPARAIGLALVELPTGYTAGRVLGRMAAYGSLGGLLARTGIGLQVRPAHLDSAAGLKPVGDFYFYQAVLAGLPAVFLAVWWLVIPAWPIARYARWREPYLALLGPAIAFEIVAFLLPMWSIHTLMVARKRELQHEADTLSARLDRTADLLTDPPAAPPADVPTDRVAALTQAYWNVEQMPTWPVDTRTWRRFTLSNLALLLPLLSQTLGADSALGRLADLIGRAIKPLTAS